MYTVSEMVLSKYTFKVLENGTAFGTAHAFIGPSLSKYQNEIHILQPNNKWAEEHWTHEFAERDAQRIVYMLNAAYQAGRESMQEDIKKLIGTK